MSLKNLLTRLASRRSGLSIYRPEAHPEPGLEGVPDFVEPLLGWRAWRVWTPPSSPDSCPAFSSVILDTPWTPRRRFSAEHSFDLGAKCRGLLDLDCSCGIYAFKKPLEAFIYLMKVRDSLLGMSVEVALGSVRLWGRVVECELGYKAQYAYPQHIYLPASFVRFLDTVSSAFGVPVGIYASTCDEELSLNVSPGLDGHGGRKLHLMQSGTLRAHEFPYQVGFYDLAALPGGVKAHSVPLPDPSLPASGLLGGPEDACWP